MLQFLLIYVMCKSRVTFVRDAPVMNPFVNNGLSHPYQFGDSTFISSGIKSIFFFFFISYFDEISVKKQ